MDLLPVRWQGSTPAHERRIGLLAVVTFCFVLPFSFSVGECSSPSSSASDTAQRGLNCTYTLVLESTEGGRFFTVAPSATYDPLFLAAVTADLTAAVFNQTATATVSRGAHFASFFPTRIVDGQQTLACHPPSPSPPPSAPSTSSSAQTTAPTGSQERNSVVVLEVKKKFNDKLPLIAVQVAVSTDLFPQEGEEDEGKEAYYFSLPSSVFTPHVVQGFFYRLLRRHHNCRLTRDHMYVFPALSIADMQAIAKGKGSGDEDEEEEGQGEEAAALTEARNLWIRQLYEKEQRHNSCRGVTCAFGIACVVIIAGLIVGALTPFLFGTCTRRQREKKDQVRLLSHQYRYR